jgi:hypothetical protein
MREWEILNLPGLMCRKLLLVDKIKENMRKGINGSEKISRYISKKGPI